VPPDRETADRDMKIALIEVIVVGIPFAGGSKSAESAWGKKNASRTSLPTRFRNARERQEISHAG
jgi:hypothetical protein